MPVDVHYPTLAESQFYVRTANTLLKLGFNMHTATLKDLSELTVHQVLSIPYCGIKTLQDMRDHLTEYGLSFKKEEP